MASFKANLKIMKKLNNERGRFFIEWNPKETTKRKINGVLCKNICPVEANDAFDEASTQISLHGGSRMIWRKPDGTYSHVNSNAAAEDAIINVIEECGGTWIGVILALS